MLGQWLCQKLSQLLGSKVGSEVEPEIKSIHAHLPSPYESLAYSCPHQLQGKFIQLAFSIQKKKCFIISNGELMCNYILFYHFQPIFFF